jgi:hypothetical protein
MTLRRVILLGLLVPAVGITAFYFVKTRTTLEYLFYLFVVPVMVVNGWEWTLVDSCRRDSRWRLEAASASDPEFMEKMMQVFGKREKIEE